MKTRILSCVIDNLSMEETLSRIEEFVNSGQPHQHVVVNVNKIVNASCDPNLRKIINQCDLVNVDGMPIIWASKLMGKSLKERVTGIDLFFHLIVLSEIKSWRVYFLGAREQIVQRVVDVLKTKYPRLDVAGFHNGYWNPEKERSVVEGIKKSRPHLLFVAISSPRKEEFLAKYKNEMAVPFSMGVGGTFDVVAGVTKRAPLWMQKNGLEWFYRFLQEPKRMFKRYFIDGMYFFWLLAKEIVKR